MGTEDNIYCSITLAPFVASLACNWGNFDGFATTRKYTLRGRRASRAAMPPPHVVWHCFYPLHHCPLLAPTQVPGRYYTQSQKSAPAPRHELVQQQSLLPPPARALASGQRVLVCSGFDLTTARGALARPRCSTHRMGPRSRPCQQGPVESPASDARSGAVPRSDRYT